MGRFRFLIVAAAAVVAVSQVSPVGATPSNVRVTNDGTTNGSYMSADQLNGGTYSDGVLRRCGVDKRMQNEPAIAIDPSNPLVRTAGSNDYCTVPTAGDAWAGFYRSSDGGNTWTDSLLPGYAGDTSAQGTSSPLAAMVAGGALAAGDPVQAWDTKGDVFFMGNNFNRGIQNGNSVDFRDNTGDVWVATYGPGSSGDGSKYVRTVILSRNTFGQGSFNDKTGIQVDQQAGSPFKDTVYAAWSDFHGKGCNEIDLSRSTDGGATFSIPMKLSGSICNNQGPNIAIGPSGQVYVSWFGQLSGTKGQNTRNIGAAFAVSMDGGRSFSMATIAVPFNQFVSGSFSHNGARECGDGPFSCPTGQTFPRFDLAQPTLTVDTTTGDVYMAFQAALSSGQGQIQWTRSTNGGATWTAPAAVDNEATGHQFFPWITSSGGVQSIVYYASTGDPNYAATRAPCNDATGKGSACLNVFYASLPSGGSTWSAPTMLTSQPTNPNLEQFGGRRVPFFGDYIMVSAVGANVQAVWTDQRDAAPGTGSPDGNDVAGDPEAGGSCTSSLDSCFDGTGGLDQNIYSAIVS